MKDSCEYSVKKARIPAWGYEITSKGFHNIAPTEEKAIDYLRWRFGHDVKIRIYDDDGNWKYAK